MEPLLIWTPLGQKKVSLLERCPHFRGVLKEGLHCNESEILILFPSVTVGASDVKDNFASFSNYGTCEDIIAPVRH